MSLLPLGQKENHCVRLFPWDVFTTALRKVYPQLFNNFLLVLKRTISDPSHNSACLIIFVYERIFLVFWLKIFLLWRWEIPKLNYVWNVELKAVKRNVGLENVMFEVRDDYTLLALTWKHRQNVGCTSFLIESNSYGEMGCEYVTRSFHSLRIRQVENFWIV